MINIARAIIVAAFLAGAFLASVNEETINWVYFVPVIVVGVIGVYLLKSSEKAAAQNDNLLASDKKILTESLNNILNNLKALDGRKDQVPTYEMR